MGALCEASEFAAREGMGNIVVADMAATGTRLCLTGGEEAVSLLHACTVFEGLIGQLREGEQFGGGPSATCGPGTRRGYEGAPASLRCSSGCKGAGHGLCASHNLACHDASNLCK